jgi:hypothetical protein
VVEVGVSGMQLRRKLYLVRNRRYPATRSQVEFWNFVSASQPTVSCVGVRFHPPPAPALKGGGF